jgi:hypothetical protein
MGRPPIGKIAMTPAERKRRQRQLEDHARAIRAAYDRMKRGKDMMIEATIGIVADVSKCSDQEFRDLADRASEDPLFAVLARYDRARWRVLAGKPDIIRACINRALSPAHISRRGRVLDPVATLLLAMRALSRNRVTK